MRRLGVLERLKVPITSRTVYKPFILIIVLTFLQLCSCSQFIKRFLIQILSSNSEEVERGNITGNMTEPELSDVDDDKLSYAYPLIILSIRLLVMLLMAVMVKRIRVRSLYFTSLFATVLLLTSLALISGPAVTGLSLSLTTVKIIKTVILCLHVIFGQMGLNTLPALMEIAIFPTSCKAAMRGIIRAISSILFVVLVFSLKFLSYSLTFYLMAAILLLSSPFLYLLVPEIRNIGSEMSAEFFLPSQTTFYFLPPNRTRLNQNPIKADFLTRQVSRDEELEESGEIFPEVKFAEEAGDLDEDILDECFVKKNQERVNYVSNILSQGNSLSASPSSRRVLVGKGPVRFEDQILKKGIIFLFNDLLIVATSIISNRRYVRELCFSPDQLQVARTENRILLSEPQGKQLEISFKDKNLASLWKIYLLHQTVQRELEEDEI